jgi:hypothetical protein
VLPQKSTLGEPFFMPTAVGGCSKARNKELSSQDIRKIRTNPRHSILLPMLDKADIERRAAMLNGPKGLGP